MKKILLAYETKTNTTKEIIESIGKKLEEKGLIVDIKRIGSIDSLENYSGAIIGAPINGMNWIPEASKFIENHQAILKDMPTALFSVAYFHGMKRKFWQNLMKKRLYTSKDLIQSQRIGQFKGKVADNNIPGFLRVLFGAPKDLPLDRRDWNEINQWAEDVSVIIK